MMIRCASTSPRTRALMVNLCAWKPSQTSIHRHSTATHTTSTERAFHCTAALLRDTSRWCVPRRTRPKQTISIGGVPLVAVVGCCCPLWLRWGVLECRTVIGCGTLYCVVYMFYPCTNYIYRLYVCLFLCNWRMHYKHCDPHRVNPHLFNLIVKHRHPTHNMPRVLHISSPTTRVCALKDRRVPPCDFYRMHSMIIVTKYHQHHTHRRGTVKAARRSNLLKFRDRNQLLK